MDDDNADAAVGWQRGWRRGERIAVALSEAGLARRPWALWLGPRALAALLSPYTFDNAGVLAALAPRVETRELVGELTPDSSVLARRAQLCAIADGLGAKHPQLLRERREVERSVGITTYAACDAVIIDTARIARIPGQGGLLSQDAQMAAGTVLIEATVHSQEAGDDAASFAALTALLGSQAQGVARVTSEKSVAQGRARRRLARANDRASVLFTQAFDALKASGALSDACHITEFEVATAAPWLATLRAASMWLSSSKR